MKRMLTLFARSPFDLLLTPEFSFIKAELSLPYFLNELFPLT